MTRVSITAWRQLCVASRLSVCERSVGHAVRNFATQGSHSSMFDGKHVSIVGAGAMAQSMVAGLLKSQILRPDQVCRVQYAVCTPLL
jgi:beta-lactamase regulating signal transducer with metallopeptidase domain